MALHFILQGLAEPQSLSATAVCLRDTQGAGGMGPQSGLCVPELPQSWACALCLFVDSWL